MFLKKNVKNVLSHGTTPSGRGNAVSNGVRTTEPAIISGLVWFRSAVKNLFTAIHNRTMRKKNQIYSGAPLMRQQNMTPTIFVSYFHSIYNHRLQILISRQANHIFPPRI